jgi:hypothetical protein
MFDDAEGKKYRPIGISTGDTKAHCAREVKPEPLPEFSGDWCDGHCGCGGELYALVSVGRLREWELSVPKQRQRRYDYLSRTVRLRPSPWPLLASSLSSSLLVLQTRHQSISHINCLTVPQEADDP